MASTFKNFKKELTTTEETIYICPANKVAIVLGIQATNADGLYEADLNLSWSDASDSNTKTPLLFATPIPPGSALSCIAGKLTLEEGDTIIAEASTDNAVTLSGSVVEMDA